MLAYSDGPPPTRRMIGLGVAVGVHALLIWALMSGLARDVIEAVQEPLEVALIAEPPVPAPTAPPPPETVKPKEAYVPPPKVKLTPPPVAPQNTIRQVQMAKPEVVPVVREPAPAIPQAIPVQGNTQPPYPPASRRNGEEGRVGLLLYVSETGKVTDGKVESSSGFERLDKVALIHARRKWTFKPAILDGRPAGHWMKYSVIFKLTD
ncbi:MAG: energy transducer TonB [Parvibaculum sp.]|nr:energy transducer TonB [Parvibaculum sp.]